MKDSKENLIEKKPWYVTCIDSFMSGWGRSREKSNKLIFGCDSLEEAEIVADNAECRTDMKYVNICRAMPRIGAHHYAQYKDKTIYPSWYIKDYFRNRQ